MRKYILPALILCLFILESVSIDIVSIRNINEDWIIVPRYILIVIILCTIYTSPYVGMICGFLFGFLYDIVYTDILGVYLFAFGIAAYVVSSILKVLHTNIFISFFLVLLSITIVEYLVYGVHSLIGTTQMMHADFLFTRLLPTLGFNALITLLLIFPIKLFMERLAIEQKEEL